MEPTQKRARKDADRPSVRSAAPQMAETQPQALSRTSNAATTDRRRAHKMYVADESDSNSQRSEDETNMEDAEASHSADANVPTPEDVEDNLVREGDKLSGQALQDFLKKNFVDFADEQLFDVADLDDLLAAKP